MLYYNIGNREKFTEAVKTEARDLDVDLVVYDLDRSYRYYTHNYQNLENLIEVIIEDMRDWFSSDKLSVKKMEVSIYNEPWDAEYVCIQTRCKR